MENMNVDVIPGQSVPSISNENETNNNFNLAALLQQNAGLQLPYQMMLLPSNITQSLLLQQQLQQLQCCNDGINSFLSNLISLNNLNSTLNQQPNVEYIDTTLLAQQMLLNNQASLINSNLVANVQNAIDNNQIIKSEALELVNFNNNNNNNVINNNNNNVINNNNNNVINNNINNNSNINNNMNSNNIIINDNISINNDINKFNNQQTISNKLKFNASKPPKKPLTPYMIFSKQVWPQVKDANKHLSSVCEIGAIVGRMWRDLGSSNKQIYNDLYFKEKERYDRELQEFFKETGMTPSDLIKPRVKRSSTGVKLGLGYSLQSHGQTINQLTAQMNQSTASQSMDPHMTSSLSSSTTPMTITPLVIAPQTTLPHTESSLLHNNDNPAQTQVASTTAHQATDMTSTTLQASSSLTEQDLFEQLGITATTMLQNGECVYSIDANTLANIIALQQQQQQQNFEVTSTEINIGSNSNIENDNNNNNNNDNGNNINDKINVVNQISSSSTGQIKLESELQEMRLLVLEKCQEIDDLTSKLNEAYSLIEQLKSIDQSTISINQSTLSINQTSSIVDQLKLSIQQSTLNGQPMASLYSSHGLHDVDNDFVHKFVDGSVNDITEVDDNIHGNNDDDDDDDDDNNADFNCNDVVSDHVRLFNNIHNEEDHNYVTKVFQSDVDNDEGGMMKGGVSSNKHDGGVSSNKHDGGDNVHHHHHHQHQTDYCYNGDEHVPSSSTSHHNMNNDVTADDDDDDINL